MLRNPVSTLPALDDHQARLPLRDRIDSVRHNAQSPCLCAFVCADLRGQGKRRTSSLLDIKDVVSRKRQHDAGEERAASGPVRVEETPASDRKRRDRSAIIRRPLRGQDYSFVQYTSASSSKSS